MENEIKNSSRTFLSEKFVWLEFLAEWKTALKQEKNMFNKVLKKSLYSKNMVDHY